MQHNTFKSRREGWPKKKKKYYDDNAEATSSTRARSARDCRKIGHILFPHCLATQMSSRRCQVPMCWQHKTSESLKRTAEVGQSSRKILSSRRPEEFEEDVASGRWSAERAMKVSCRIAHPSHEDFYRPEPPAIMLAFERSIAICSLTPVQGLWTSLRTGEQQKPGYGPELCFELPR